MRRRLCWWSSPLDLGFGIWDWGLGLDKTSPLAWHCWMQVLFILVSFSYIQTSKKARLHAWLVSRHCSKFQSWQIENKTTLSLSGRKDTITSAEKFRVGVIFQSITNICIHSSEVLWEYWRCTPNLTTPLHWPASRAWHLISSRKFWTGLSH